MGKTMILICGPCVIEDKETLIEIAKILYNELDTSKHDVYFKASCIKDNRTSLKNFQGIGFLKGIDYLKFVKQTYGFKITTDFHNMDHLATYSSEVDLIQVPALLCEQTSIVYSAAVFSGNKPVHYKKGQFLSPHEIRRIVDKLPSEKNQKDVFITDRGTCFGYNTLMMDPRSVPIMKNLFGGKILVDITHPNKYWNDYKLAFTLGKSYVAAGADGIFAEVHINPSYALCDKDTMIPVREFVTFMRKFDSA